jgi:RNA polymerase sigma-70 factor (ECF subfamily)
MDHDDECDPRRAASDLRVEQAYEAHASELRGYAGARLRDPGAAEEVVQESFLRLLRESKASRFPGQPRAWLYRVALNLIISGARSAAVARRQAIWEFGAEAMFDSPETHFLAAESRRSLGVALGAAAPDARKALLLAARGYSGREIAEVLGRSEGATRVLLCRARKDMRRNLIGQDAASIAV